MRSFLAASLILLLSPLHAAESSAPTLAETGSKTAQGLTLTFSAGGKQDFRSARLISLHVVAGQPVTPFLPAGAFAAKWEGEINSPLRAEYTFSAEARGNFKLTINGTAVIESNGSAEAQSPIRLNKGANKLVAELTSDGKSDAFLRLNWRSAEFPNEPVPPTVFSHNANSTGLREADRLREGRMLFATMRCSACHSDPLLIPPKGAGMPELAQDAPLFNEIGAKFKEPWLAHWIADPHSIRPHSLMPKVFATGKPGEIDQRAADLAAFFSSTGNPVQTALPLAEDAPAGGALFANLGCISCHTPPDFSDTDKHNRTPLSHVKAKWNPVALRDYLREPAKNYAWTHMPDFRLSEREAEQLTAYLVSGKQREFTPGPKGDAGRGAQLLVSSGCLNCHAGLPPTTQPSLATTLKNGWSKGCMAENDGTRGTAPDFALSKDQRSALQAFAATGFPSLKQDAPVEFAERQAVNLRCAACHARDGQGSTWSDLQDEMAALLAAAPPHVEEEGAPIAGPLAPMLTWAGEKLQPAWMETFIAGHSKTKPRPWIIARMPGFATVAKSMAEGLSLEHGFASKAESEPPVDKAKGQNGEKLLGEDGGFNCTTCHGVGARAATAVFEAPGINLAESAERLRKGYYHRWVLHPLRIDPETKMPRFADDEGKTPLTDLYDGNAGEQFDAIWQYLRTVKK